MTFFSRRITFWSRFLLVVLLTSITSNLFFSVPKAQAATVDDLSDQPSTLVNSTDSNHRITFTLVDSVVAGETVTITFPSAFDTSTITEDDVDVAIGNNDVSTDSACGTANLSVTIAADVITFTSCPAVATVPAGSVIEIEIGASASAYGTGTHRVTNPTTNGTYYIALGGTSGNDGSIPLPIGPISGATLAVILLGASSNPDNQGGGGGGGGLPDIIRDIIEDHRDDDDEEDPDEDPDEEPDEEEPEDPGPVEDPDGTPDAGGGDGDSEPDDDETPSDIDDGVVIDIDFYATPDLRLNEDEGGVDVIPGTSTIVVVNVDADTQPTSVIVVVGDTEYVLAPNENGIFTGIISAPAADDVVGALAVFEDGTQASTSVGVNVQTGGLVYEVIDDERVPVPDTVLTVYEFVGGAEVAWNAAAYGQNNPGITSSGYFSWYVPNGTYVIYAEKDGYREARSVVGVSNNILSSLIELEREEEEEVLPIPLPPSVEETVKDIQEILNTPEAETVADIALPAAAAVATGTVATLAFGFNLLPYLQYAFTSPFLLFGRRKRRAYGVVYNAFTKVPVELAIVRVYRLPDNRLVKTVVTSPEGKYSLAVPPGQYRLQVIKPGYIFPSQYLKDTRVDGKFLDIYSGQMLEVSDDSALIVVNIPLDPAQTDAFHAPRNLAIKRFVRSLQMIMAPLGVVLSVAVFVISPSWIAGGMLVIQCFVLLFVLRLAKPKKPKGWGIVYDEVTHRPVGNTVIRLFEPKYNKLVETTLTDSLGRYSFLLGPNEYFVSYNKPGYSEKIVRPVDYSAKQEPAPWAINVALQHVSGEPHVSARQT